MKSYKIKSKKNNFKSNKLISPSAYKKSKKRKLTRKKLLQIWAIWFWVIFILLFVLFQIRIKWDLPDINQIRDITFSQATVITDRNDNVLYKLFSENREYVEYSWINKNMINAIVAVEDQRYREHKWLDTIWLFRAVISKIIRPSSRMQWASTIPQQLVRNLLLTKDRKVERKLKEMVLTKKLDNVLEDMVKDSLGKIDWDQMTHKKKELTLELYFNKIEFGNNAFGIESASKTYFWKSAIDLTILESSILASIPKWPSSYNPYTKRSATIWSLKITDNDGNEYSLSNTWLKSEVVDKIESIFSKSNFSNKKDYSSFSKYLNWLIDFSLYLDWTKYNVKYSVWRKDLVLSRMFQDEYITEGQLKEALLNWMTIKLKTAGFDIQAPHFVMRVKELLQDQYDEETLLNWWLVVKNHIGYGYTRYCRTIYKKQYRCIGYVLSQQWSYDLSRFTKLRCFGLCLIYRLFQWRYMMTKWYGKKF